MPVNEEDAPRLTTVLLDHFPQMTPGDARLCWSALRAYPLALAADAVARHRSEQGVKVFRPDPQRIAAFCRDAARAAAGKPTTWAERTAEYRKDMAAEAERAAAERTQIDRMLATMTA